MRFRELCIRIGLMAMGTLWAITLILMGVKLAVSPWPEIPRESALWFGIASIAAGEFLFMYIVADRVFPRRRRVLSDLMEQATAGIFVLGLGLSGLFLLMSAA
ncbi:MAG: hypothetical protein ACFHWZ_03255 [Phycisphaerales bacterium]|nr:hypothetical protein [bacterium]